MNANEIVSAILSPSFVDFVAGRVNNERLPICEVVQDLIDARFPKSSIEVKQESSALLCNLVRKERPSIVKLDREILGIGEVELI